jgi:heme exporter protein C
MIRYTNLQTFNKISKLIQTPLILMFGILFPISILYIFFLSPQDYQQGEMVRVMYIHVPFAWLSLMIYCAIGILSIITIVWKSIVSYIYAQSLSCIGAIFCGLTLITGMLWGKPVWGTYWVWDARLTSMLILLLLYIGYISISYSDNFYRAVNPASVLAIIGLINIPIVKFSVNIWYSLHQGPSIIRSGGVSIHKTMMTPLILMFLTLLILSCILFIIRVRTIIIKLKKINNDLRSD